MNQLAHRDQPAGIAYGLAAYLWWGLVPIYFKAVASVPAVEVLAHRVVWSVVLLSVIVARQQLIPEVLRAIRTPAIRRTLALTTVLIATNWLVYIHSVVSNQLLESSLGYFINPLVNVLLGVIVLGERLRWWRWVSVGLAVAGVVVMTVRLGHLPWIALVLALSFGLYGLFRKMTPVGAVAGLGIETAMLAPLALAYLGWATAGGTVAFAHAGRSIDLLLVASGIVTTVPLLWFAGAARRIRLSTLGFLQYLAPTLQFLLAVFAYGEPLDAGRLVAFAFIWAGLAVFAAGSARESR